jgi:hypothetical protein
MRGCCVSCASDRECRRILRLTALVAMRTAQCGLVQALEISDKKRWGRMRDGDGMDGFEPPSFAVRRTMVG